MQRSQRTLERRILFAALLAAGLASPGLGWAQDTEERIRQLEDQLRTVTDELKAIKQQMREDRDARAAVKRPQQDPAAAASQAGELRDRVQALEQRVDQVPQARLANGLTFEDPRGLWAARFTGRVQGDYRYFDPADAVPGTFSVRRARIGLELTAFKDYTFYVEGEFATGNAQGGVTQTASITNAWLDLNWFPQARPRIGQFKPPIGLENYAPDVLTDFMERSLTQSLLQNLNYDRGIMVQGIPYQGIYYGVSLTNGMGLNLEERNTSSQDVAARGKDVTARVAVNFAPYLDWSDAVIHVGAGYKNGDVSNATNGATGFVAATGRTEAFGTTFFTPQAFNGVTGATTATNIDREITVGELALAWKQFKLQSEYWNASYSGTRLAPTVAGIDRSIDAYYISAFWLLTGEAYADAYSGSSATFGRIRPRNNFSFGGGGWGAWELGLRYSRFDASDFTTTNSAGTGVLGATSTNKADAWTVGLKWIANPYTRFLLNYVQTEFDTPVTTNGVSYSDEKAVLFRAQFDF